jgi:hypothetical protein
MFFSFRVSIANLSDNGFTSCASIITPLTEFNTTGGVFRALWSSGGGNFDESDETDDTWIWLTGLLPDWRAGGSACGALARGVAARLLA